MSIGILYWAAFAGGVLVGLIIGVVSHFTRRVEGTLRIDHTNPEKDLYRFDIEDLDGLSRKKKILLKVDNDAHIS